MQALHCFSSEYRSPMRIVSWGLTLVVAWGALAAAASADAPFSFDTAYGRLPKNVKPLAYTIAVVPDVKTMRIDGTERIALAVRSRTATIRFNSLNERLHDVRFDGAPVAGVVSSDAEQLTTVTLARPANVGRHTLSFGYTARIGTNAYGLFLQRYTTPDGRAGQLLQTMFESTDARRMFPCWDEPAFRATFQLSATVPADLATVSNMPIVKRTVRGTMATTTFATTPPMPSYLVEFTAGHIAAIQEKRNGTLFRVWAVRGQERGGAVALANAEQILADYNDYFGVRFPLPKLDSLAIPGGFNGAMENWGAIVYDDEYLLFTPSSTIDDRQQIYGFQSHEMAHQWNGDLVTMGWWDDLWLNESFASWLSAKETADRNPTWKWWENQDGDKEYAMNADARSTSHPIRVHITNELEAETAFDNEITYAKGQAFLRMLEAYLRPNVFRDGVRRYMKARAYSNATAADLWIALSQASRVDVGRLASTWVDRPGFPLVSVRASCDATGHRTIALEQERFLFAGTDASHTRWMIPLAIRSGAAGTTTELLMTTTDATAAAGRCNDPLTVNAGLLGFYRVAYDDATLKTNTAAFGTLPDADRIALLDDQWALARAGKAPLASFLTLAGAMGDDRDARAWAQIADSLSSIEVDERGSSGHDAYVAYARSVLAPLAVALGWNPAPGETPDVGQLRRSVLGYLGAWGDPAVIAEARKRFAAFLTDRSAIPLDDQQTVLSIVAANADATTFDQLHALAKASKSDAELRRVYLSMMTVHDEMLAQRALEIALSAEIPPQDADLQGNLVWALSANHPVLAWHAFTEHWEALIKSSGSSAPLVLAQYVPEQYWNAVSPAEMESFVKARVAPSMLPNLARGMERMRFALDQRRRFVVAADAYVTSLSH